MCGRFALNENPAILREHFQLNNDFEFQSSWNIAPSLPICTITADEASGRHLRKMRWVLIPSWAQDAKIGNMLSNARGETVAEKPSFRSAWNATKLSCFSMVSASMFCHFHFMPWSG
ncbi:SOS response-associated peptidase [Candidatus Nitrotoga sp. M5]|uniref:SOS response-associated peptidase n=1 Tax=Candidatus Nitrotoga sp. M5 TaxID=2890409 RepID=UPI001EF67A0B|nr:SOS response-associated peptidase family protein [Candidatus Nitrotoga sp. M5]